MQPRRPGTATRELELEMELEMEMAHSNLRARSRSVEPGSRGGSCTVVGCRQAEHIKW